MESANLNCIFANILGKQALTLKFPVMQFTVLMDIAVFAQRPLVRIPETALNRDAILLA
jgi:hypothetical protein